MIKATRTIRAAYTLTGGGAMEPDMEKIIKVLISLLADQEGVTIEYTLEKTA